MKQPSIPLQKIRREQGLRQEAVAQALGIQTTTYSKLERGVIQLTVERLYALASVFGLSPQVLLSYGQSAVAEGAVTPSADQQTSDNITYIPVHAQAGFLDLHADQRKADAAITFSIPTFTEPHLFMISVEGDSMYPTVVPGAFVIIKEVKDTQLIKWGEPHVVVTTDGRVIKRVLKHSDAQQVTLYSDNNALYQPYDIPKNSILSLWQLVGSLSKSFVPQHLFRGALPG